MNCQKYTYSLCLLAVTAAICLPSPVSKGNSSLAFAEETTAGAPAPAAKEEDKEKVRTGLIAASDRVSTNSDGVVPADTGDSAPGGEANAIGASVSNDGRGKCTATLINSSEKNGYRVRFAIVGEKNGRRTLNRSMSASLKPGEKSTHEVSCGKDLNVGVELRSANKMG